MLQHLGITPTVIVSEADENVIANTPEEAVCLIAQKKARAVQSALLRPLKNGSVYLDPDDLILAADTIVLSPDGELLGKPQDREDAARMLRALSGREHRVISGICLIRGDRIVTASEVTTVRFSALDEEVIAAYVDSGECDDKAGAYGIQDTAALWIEGICGDYFNVVGLPVHRLESVLGEQFGLSLWT
jgi:septum formation protein